MDCSCSLKNHQHIIRMQLLETVRWYISASRKTSLKTAIIDLRNSSYTHIHVTSKSEFYPEPCNSWITLLLSDCNWTRTQNHLVRNRTLNHLASLAKWLSVRLRTKWFWVQVQLQSLKLQISRLLQVRSSFTFRQL